MTGTPYIPNQIVVHLGAPGQEAENVYVSFPDYIKNVASSEIYPTWPEAALRANIYAQISFALNRYYTEWYRSQGYDFDITNSTRYDQSYVPGRDIYDSVSRIVDEIFNSYVVRRGSVEPYFTQYCNGTTTTCNGLSQWGTVELAEQGLGAYDILTRYYGDTIDIVSNVPIRNGPPSYPGRVLLEGDNSNDVQLKQIQLNRISSNYPGIPKIAVANGLFGVDTKDAVKAFQRIFNLTQDGLIGPATWNRISYIYNAVKRLSELDSEGISRDELPSQFEGEISLGSQGIEVQSVQYFLNVVAAFYNTIPRIAITGIYDQATDEAVRAYQQAFGLEVDGIMDRETWNLLYDTYLSIVDTSEFIDGGVPLFSGRALAQGSTGEDVAMLQEYLSYISQTYPQIPAPSVTGVYGMETENAVRAFQQLFGLPDTGTVGAVTWDTIASTYSDLRFGNTKRLGQYPGAPLSREGTV